jgi:hypothetical protein
VIRKLALVLVLAVGVFWLVSTFAFGYPAKMQAVDNLTNAFRPAFTDAGIQQSKADIATINSFATDFQTKAVPALAKQLNLTPAQLVAALGAQYPDVGKGVQQLPVSLPYFNHLVEGLAAQEHNFQQADAIPTKTLPATTVHWLFVILGLLTLGIGLFGLLLRPKSAALLLSVSAAVGLAVIAVTMILSVPSKARAVDAMTDAFRPVFPTQGAAQTRAAEYGQATDGGGVARPRRDAQGDAWAAERVADPEFPHSGDRAAADATDPLPIRCAGHQDRGQRRELPAGRLDPDQRHAHHDAGSPARRPGRCPRLCRRARPGNPSGDHSTAGEPDGRCRQHGER